MTPGVITLFFASLMLGLLGSVLYTVIMTIIAVIYNGLGKLGGGIRIVVEDETMRLADAVEGVTEPANDD